jgi:NADH dehydrogenase [ubiquinone] 1 alpha subcomplex assembly factor 1
LSGKNDAVHVLASKLKGYMMVFFKKQSKDISRKVQLGIGLAFGVVGVIVLLGQPVFSASKDKMIFNCGLFHFSDPSHFTTWNINNDTVMGGISQSNIESKQRVLLFTGTVSLDNNGGFASTESIFTHQITDESLLTLEVKGDGKTYQIRLKTPYLSQGEAYVANFTSGADKLTRHEFTAEDFTVSFRGRTVANAPSLNFDDIVRVGFLVAQKQQGPFSIELHSMQFSR